MRKIRDVLRLSAAGLSKRQIAASLGIGPTTAGACLRDFALTFGQTFSDVASQTHTNVAVSVTPGVRVPSTAWKFTLPITVTGREYEDVVGGRRDMFFQVRSALTHSPPPFTDRYGESFAIMFSLPVTYNQNYSTIWHGFVVMPTLTVAFQPAVK